jgi:hypothetical protein
LAPTIRSFVVELRRPDIQYAGTGGAPVDSASALGLNFYPDAALRTASQRLLAIEVKFLRGTQRQYSLATALGQALLYRRRYRYVVAFLVDSKLTSTEELQDLKASASQAGVDVVLRRVAGKELI